MTVDTTSLYTSSSSTSSTSSDSDSSSLTSDFETFLSLLVTELENQNPLDPMDTTDFINQLVGFSQVEQQMETNDTLDTISDSIDSLSVSTALSYVGTDVTVAGETAPLSDDSDGIDWIYDLDSAAADVTLTIYDEEGDEVYTTSGDTEEGLNYWTWDGTDNDGDACDEGVYTLEVTATDTDGNDIDVGIAFSSTVTAVDTSDGDVTLELDGQMRVSVDTLEKIES